MNRRRAVVLTVAIAVALFAAVACGPGSDEPTPSAGSGGGPSSIAGIVTDLSGATVAGMRVVSSAARPGIVARSATMPWVSECDDRNSTWPWDWPKSQDHTSLTRGGFGCGVELPVVAQRFLDAVAEPDQARRIEINNLVADHLFEMAISPGIVGQPRPITYNPNSIAAWPMNPALFSSVTDYESIVPAPR